MDNSPHLIHLHNSNHNNMHTAKHPLLFFLKNYLLTDQNITNQNNGTLLLGYETSMLVYRRRLFYMD